ncbi:MAG: four helix bundle protein [Nitrospira sp.]|nr:four helix bundle protein [Nitrospira sp.]
MLQAEQLRQRTKQFALAVLGLVRDLPRTDEARVLGRQLLRSGTSLAANYRAACRARSKAEFISKMSVVIEETDETEFWLELSTESGMVASARTAELLREVGELLAIFVASRRTARGERGKE